MSQRRNCPTDSDHRVAADWPCICGASLRGLDAEGDCPRCGRPIAPQLVRIIPTPSGLHRGPVWSSPLELVVAGVIALAGLLASNALIQHDFVRTHFRSNSFFFIGMPLLGLLSAAAAYWKPRHPWRWALVLALTQPFQPLLANGMAAWSDPESGALWMTGPCCFGGVLVPCLLLAYSGAGLRMHMRDDRPSM